ncbi:hypothetical protein V6N12_046896 [Hibiscus sabdariffa]|uniref:Uncharacterized protein n=1 Tax=Hibiscus sabdariffa TaxID=183260 RepID=A0ABR2BBY8_9ROSI
MISSSLYCRHRAIARRRSSELTGELRPPPRSSLPMLSPSHLGLNGIWFLGAAFVVVELKGLLVWLRGECSIMVGGQWIGSTVRSDLF